MQLLSDLLKRVGACGVTSRSYIISSHLKGKRQHHPKRAGEGSTTQREEEEGKAAPPRRERRRAKQHHPEGRGGGQAAPPNRRRGRKQHRPKEGRERSSVTRKGEEGKSALPRGNRPTQKGRGKSRST